jgi:hypothetical protein
MIPFLSVLKEHFLCVNEFNIRFPKILYEFLGIEKHIKHIIMTFYFVVNVPISGVGVHPLPRSVGISEIQ